LSLAESTEDTERSGYLWRIRERLILHKELWGLKSERETRPLSHAEFTEGTEG